MVPKKIVRLHDIHVVDLGCLQNLTRAFRTGNIRSRPHFAPFTEGACDSNLGPNPDDQRHADVKEPMRSKTETVWIKHTDVNLMYRTQLSLCWLEQIRREIVLRVHSAARACWLWGIQASGACSFFHVAKIATCPQTKCLRSGQISNCFGKRDRILQPVFVTNTTSSSRTPPSPG